MATAPDWELLDGQVPFAELDTHPSGAFVARQAVGRDERAAVFDAATGRIVWNPGNASALCWAAGGAEVLLVRQNPRPDRAALPRYSAGPFPPSHAFERRTWPALGYVESAPFEPPDGWVVGVVANPRRRFACVRWRDQCCSGAEFVDWSAGPAQQLARAGYNMGTNFDSNAAFSPDGRLMACAYASEAWWDGRAASGGAKVAAGAVVVTDLVDFARRAIPVSLAVPPWWKPDDPKDFIAPTLFTGLRFVTGDEFAFESGLGHRLRFRVTGERLA